MDVKMKMNTKKKLLMMMVMNRLFGSGLVFGMSWIWNVTVFVFLSLGFTI